MNILDKFLNTIRLNDDFDDDDDFFDEDEAEEEVPKRHFTKRIEDDLDDDDDFFRSDKKSDRFSDKKTEKKSKSSANVKMERMDKTSTASSKVTPMRTRKQVSGSNMEVCVIKPSSMDDTREIADTLLDRCTVVLNLEGIDVDIAQRIIDFSSGACYALDGRLQKISSYIFILTPSTVEISGDFQEILNSSLDIASVRKNF